VATEYQAPSHGETNSGIFYISLIRITCYGIAWKRIDPCGFFTITWKRSIGRTLWKFLRVPLLIMNDGKSGGRCFLNVLFDFKERCSQHALFLIVSTMFSRPDSRASSVTI
jgi:hypothetical protein